jgi:enterochelin esterase-like enzyme
MRDLGCRREFSEFLAKEMAPFLQRKYGASSAATAMGVGGVSRGGLAAVCAALQAPYRFGMVISQSGSLWYVPGRSHANPTGKPAG